MTTTMLERAAPTARDPGRWRRRAITLPAVFIAAALAVALFPVALPLAFLGDLIQRKRFALTRTTVFFLGYLVGEVTFISACGLLWLFAPGFTKKGRERLERWTHPMSRAWGCYLDGFGRWCFSVKLDVTGLDAFAAGGPVMVFLRHASAADNLLAPRVVGRHARLDTLYVAKAELQNDPIFDIIGNRIRACFVRRGSGNAETEMAAMQAMLDGIKSHEAIICFPEGTRFSEGKRKKILASIEKRGDAAQLARAKALRHVLPPNLGGPVALLERATEGGEPVDVIFCMHAGYEGAATLADFHQGRAIGRTVRVHFERVPFSELPRGREAIAEWFYQRWEKLDAWVAAELPRVLETAVAS